MSDTKSSRFVRGYLKMRHLVLLCELGRHGSISKAAKAAHLTQPAASTLLRELEESLGVPLFERGQNGVASTWYGDIMIRRAAASLGQMDAAYHELADMAAGRRGYVSLGAILTPSTTLVPSAVTLLRNRHPGSNVAIEVDDSRNLVERLRTGQLDIAIARLDEPDACGDLTFEPIGDEQHCLVVRTGHPLLDATDLDLAALNRQLWILPPEDSLVRRQIASLFASADMDMPDDVTSTTDPSLVFRLLTNSDMIAPMPVDLVQPYLRNKMLAMLPFELNIQMDVYGILTSRHQKLSATGQAMLQALRDTAFILGAGDCPPKHKSAGKVLFQKASRT